MKKFLIIIFILILLLSSCSHKDEQPKKIMLILHAWSSEFSSEITRGANAAAKENDINLLTKAVSKEVNVPMQEELIKKAIEEGYDGIILEPLDSIKIEQNIKTAIDNNINVVLINSNKSIDGTKEVNIDIEKLNTLLMKEITKSETPKVLLLNCIDFYDDTLQMRNYLIDELNKNNIPCDSLNFSILNAGNIISSLEYTVGDKNNFNVIIALNEFSTLIAAKQIHKISAEDGIKLIAFSKSLKTINELEKGCVSDICVTDYFSLGYIAVESVLNENGVISKLITPQIINKDNLYYNQNQKIMFPVD